MNARDPEAANRHKHLGILSFFVNVDVVEVFFEERIINKKFLQFPNEIKKMRNILIYLTMIQILASILASIYIIFRRSLVYLLINSISLGLAICGVYGAMEVEKIKLLVHCVLTISITGCFSVYQIFELFLVKDTSYGVSSRLNDNLLMFFFSIPYFYDFCAGVYNYYFLKKVAEFIAEKNSKQEKLIDTSLEDLKKTYTNEEIKNHLASCNKNQCIICLDKERDTIMNPCGHLVACLGCTEKIFRDPACKLRTARCPICRKEIQTFKKVYFA